jgi:hypothetical protein
MNPDLKALIQILIEGQIQLEEGMITHGEPEPLTDQQGGHQPEICTSHVILTRFSVLH